MSKFKYSIKLFYAPEGKTQTYVGNVSGHNSRKEAERIMVKLNRTGNLLKVGYKAELTENVCISL